MSLSTTDRSTFTIHTEYHHRGISRSRDELGSVVEDYGCIANTHQGEAGIDAPNGEILTEPDNRGGASHTSSLERQGFTLQFVDTHSEVSFPSMSPNEDAVDGEDEKTELENEVNRMIACGMMHTNPEAQGPAGSYGS
jgi:hypothetical protein